VCLSQFVLLVYLALVCFSVVGVIGVICLMVIGIFLKL